MQRFFLYLATFFLSLSASAYYDDILERDSLRYDQLEPLLRLGNVQSIEGFLVTLSKAAPIYLDRHILMFKSRSIQCATPEAPRVILYGESAKLILAFNGGVPYCGGSTVEVLHFHDDSRQAFELREITFQKGQSPTFSEANPRKCLACHQSPTRVGVDPRPNWEPYNIWPGAFGGISVLSGDIETQSNIVYDERFGKAGHRSFGEQLLLDEHFLEKERWQEFMRIRSTHPRYKFLRKTDLHLPTDFTRFVQKLNHQRLLRQMKDQKDIWEAYGATFEGLMECGQLYVGPEVHQWHRQRMGPTWMQTNGIYRHASATPFFLGNEAMPVDPAKMMWGPSVQGIELYPYLDITEGLQWLLEPLGLAHEDVGTDFKTMGRFSFLERFGTPDNPHNQTRMAVEVFDPDVRRRGCEELKVQSLKETSNAGLKLRQSLESTPPSMPQEPPLIETCARCHSQQMSRSEVPFINFLDMTVLRQQLKKTGFRRGTLLEEIRYRISDLSSTQDQMPPRSLSTTAERNRFIKFLESL